MIYRKYPLKMSFSSYNNKSCHAYLDHETLDDIKRRLRIIVQPPKTNIL